MGYLTPDTLITANVPACLVLDDEVEALTKEVASLRAKGVDIVIALGHAGYLMDQKVAREVPGIDIIVGAHSHSFLFTENGTSTNPNSNRIEGDPPPDHPARGLPHRGHLQRGRHSPHCAGFRLH